MSSVSSASTMTCQCVRCQQNYTLTRTYQITHICRQCKNKLVEVWQEVEKSE